MAEPDAGDRPSPEALLEEANRERRGRLKIFLGAAPGVGKTYAMLEDARARLRDGTDVVIGVVETHGRKDTEALLDGLAVLPRRRIEYRGRPFQEMDLDAILARRPALVLVDELAHTNIPGSRHVKRWQDVEEILDRAQAADPREPLEGLGLPLGEQRPWVIMVVGVNGAGKTTTIGKLAAKMKARGKSVILAAGDTFRAAATEQLDVWAERAEVPIVKGPENSDPGAVVFDAVKRAVAEGIDVVIADTAGRLHTKAPLMEELKRVKRVIGKAREGAPDETLLVLDATNGQNAIQQARQFHEALGVTGIVLTKLDGTAKGGVVIGIGDELKIPVRMIGIGESLADLRPFDPKEFVAALFG